MTNTTTTASNLVNLEVVPTTQRTSLWKAGAVAGALAAIATTAVAVAARAGDIHVAVGGEAIPLAGFAQLTLFFTLIGVVIAKVLSRRASRPRRTFTVATVTLTLVSFVPDLLAEATVATKMTLMLTHLVAAAIVIPTLAARLEG